MREGVSCGLSIIATNSTTSGLGYRYMSNFACRVALKCNDSGEYMNLFDRCRMEPKDTPGRMLCKINKELYEMQSFIAFEGEKEIERSNAVKKFIENINSKYPDMFAKKIPSVPEVLTFKYIDTNYNKGNDRYRYPIGLEYSNVDLVTLDLKSTNELCIIGRDNKRNMAALSSILAAIHRTVLTCPVSMYVIDSIERTLKSKSEFGYIERYTIDYSEIGNILDKISIEMEKRYEYLINGDMEELAHFDKKVIVINNRDTIEFISSNKDLLETYMNIVKKYKALGVTFIFSDIEDAAVGYNSPDLLRRFKEERHAIITSDLQEFKFCDIAVNVIRNNKNINAGDCFLMNGSDVLRIKLVEEVE